MASVNGCCWEGTLTLTACCESTEDRVKRLQRERDETDKALADAKAKLEQEQADAAETYGEKAFDRALLPYRISSHPCRDGQLYSGFVAPPGTMVAALDQAYADGKAEMRKAAEAVCRDYAKNILNGCEYANCAEHWRYASTAATICGDDISKLK